MTSVYKYPIAVRDRCSVHMPAGARILHVGMQRGDLCAWALVDPCAPIVERRLHVAGTGNPCDATADQHVGTVFAGPYVLHVFDMGVSDDDR